MTSAPLRIIIADDELLARKRLTRLLGAMAGVELIGTCESGAEVVRAVREQQPDVVLLDIRMPELSGIEACALLEDTDVAVVFVTAHAEHAAAAFDLDAADYVVKPVDAARLRRAVERASRRVARGRAGGSPAPSRRLPIRTRRGLVLVAPDDITHASFDGEIVAIHTAERDYLSDYTLTELEQRLPNNRFVRASRRALLNLDKVTVLEPLETGGYMARTTAGALVTVSRQAARRLRRDLGIG